MRQSRVLGLVGAAFTTTAVHAVDAQAQSSPYAEPIVGAAKKSATSQQLDILTIEPTFTTVWDSNALRRNPDIVGSETDNVRASPAVNIGLNRIFGRTRVAVKASLGYDFNSRFDYLNQERISTSSAVVLPIGSQCPVQLNGSYQRWQYDFNETEQITKSIQNRTLVSIDLTCQHAGLSPNAGASFQRNTSSANALANTNYYEGHAGVQLGIPSVGSLVFSAQFARINRPNAIPSNNAKDNTDIVRYYVGLNRNVATRLTVNGKLGYARASPSRTGASPSSSIYLDGELAYAFTPNLSVTLGGLKDVQESIGIAATYIDRREVRASVSYDGIYKTRLNAGIVTSWRKFEGSQLSATRTLMRDRIQTFRLSATRTLGRRLTLGLTGNIQHRNADNAYYAYDGKSVTLNLGAKF